MAQGLGSGFTSTEILSMQKDAVRRVNEMQRIAQEKLRNTSAQTSAPIATIDSLELHNQKSESQKVIQHNPDSIVDNLVPPLAISSDEHIPAYSMEGDTIITYRDDSNGHTQSTPPNCSIPINKPSGFEGILQKLNLDDEKITIILLLIVLVNEGADTMLILALVYILL